MLGDVTESQADPFFPAARPSVTINRQMMTRPEGSDGGFPFIQQHTSDIAHLLKLIVDSCLDFPDGQKEHFKIVQRLLMTGLISGECLTCCEFHREQCQYEINLKQLEKIANEGPLFIQKYRKKFVARIKKQSANTHFMLKDRKIYDDLLSISGSFMEKYKSHTIQFEHYANLVQPTPFVVTNNYWGLFFYNDWTRRQSFSVQDFGPVESHFSFGIRTTHALANVPHNDLSDYLNWIKPTYAEIVWGVQFTKIFEKIQMHNR